MGDNRNSYEVLVGGPEGGHWDNIKVILKKELVRLWTGIQ
jgi:hypothetical protein